MGKALTGKLSCPMTGLVIFSSKSQCESFMRGKTLLFQEDIFFFKCRLVWKSFSVHGNKYQKKIFVVKRAEKHRGVCIHFKAPFQFIQNFEL